VDPITIFFGKQIDDNVVKIVRRKNLIKQQFEFSALLLAGHLRFNYLDAQLTF